MHEMNTRTVYGFMGIRYELLPTFGLPRDYEGWILTLAHVGVSKNKGALRGVPIGTIIVCGDS